MVLLPKFTQQHLKPATVEKWNIPIDNDQPILDGDHKTFLKMTSTFPL
jgi:hypothetical protein